MLHAAPDSSAHAARHRRVAEIWSIATIRTLPALIDRARQQRISGAHSRIGRLLGALIALALLASACNETDQGFLPGGSEVSAGIGTPSYPEPGDVGIPQGTTLRRLPGAEYLISDDNTVLDGVDVGCVKLQANNIVIRNSRITCYRSQPAIWLTSNVRGLLVEDSEVRSGGANISKAGVYSASAITVRRTNIHHVIDGMQPGTGSLIEQNWIHDLAGTGHNDGIQLTGGSNIRILDNRIEHKRAQTAALMIKADISPISNVRVEGNLIAGGGFAVYVHRGVRAGGCCAEPSDVVVTNNTFEPGSFMFGAMVIQGNTVTDCNFLRDGTPVVYYTETNRQQSTTSQCPLGAPTATNR